MDDLHDFVAARVERAWQAECSYERLVETSGVGREHAKHLLRFAVQRIAEGTTSTVDPYALASTWINARR
jgi:hypothetical protein